MGKVQAALACMIQTFDFGEVPRQHLAAQQAGVLNTLQDLDIHNDLAKTVNKLRETVQVDFGSDFERISKDVDTVFRPLAEQMHERLTYIEAFLRSCQEDLEKEVRARRELYESKLKRLKEQEEQHVRANESPSKSADFSGILQAINDTNLLLSGLTDSNQDLDSSLCCVKDLKQRLEANLGITWQRREEEVSEDARPAKRRRVSFWPFSA